MPILSQNGGLSVSLTSSFVNRYSIVTPSLLHRKSIVSMEKRWNCDGTVMELLRKKRLLSYMIFCRQSNLGYGDEQTKKESRQANLSGLNTILNKHYYLFRSVNVATRLNSTSSKSLSVAPSPSVSRRLAAILYFLTSTSLTALARASESFWFSSGLPSGEA